ncbi:MAG: hypothetical protein O7D32_01990 [bacterium]|nr:hypothetical protein [bacterium]
MKTFLQEIIFKLATTTVAALGLVLVSGTVAFAQDSNYWSQQYGTRSELLGGTVVGSIVDLSATYYNPGALGIIDDPEVLLSAQAFQYQSITVKDLIALTEDIQQTRFGTAPSLFAVMIKTRVQGGKIAFSVLTRMQFKARLVARLSRPQDVISSVPGNESLVGEAIAEQDMNENWFGLTWARAYGAGSEHGVGATTYLVYRGQRTRSQTNVEIVDATDTGGSLGFVDDYNYYHYRLLWKIGYAREFNKVSFGVALTTPGVGLFGSGSAYFNRSIINLDANNDGSRDSALAANEQKGMSAEYKSPLSVAAGAKYRFMDSIIHITGEWFNNIDPYEVMSPDPFSDQVSGATLRRSFVAGAENVFNIGIGVDYRLREKLVFSGAFTTDFSFAPDSTGSDHLVTNWDIYHVTMGLAGRIHGLDLTLGGDYAWGSAPQVPIIDLGSISDSGGLFGNRGEIEVVYRRLKIIVGFAFSF